MDNKLSELSKPVGFIEQSGMDYLRSGADADIWPDGGRGGDIPLYSQEYVSALISEHDASQKALKSVTELWNEQRQRNAELELRLAVEIEPPPVIYPGRYDCHAMHSAIRRAGFRVSGDSEHVGDVDMRDERALAAVSDKQRIAELEAIKADASQVFKEIGNELGCNPDNESIMMAIDDLKATQVTGPLALIIKRTGEMERILEGVTPEMIAGGWTAKGISDYAKSLEAKLATPVRLPQLCGDADNDTEYTEGLNDGITQSAIYLRRQGFTVEGDE
ncbi:hypothetical protein [Serratia marcescens]|uniref:hypothetical protein n=1 Tax=Serratia marcescens TaxID=615 RepID=UPI001157FEA7|nr:hypothetical protein [Serratia marcescens]